MSNDERTLGGWLVLALAVLGFGLWHFIGTEKSGEAEVYAFEQGKLYPDISLGYARGAYYAPDVNPKQDVAYFYRPEGKLEVNQVQLEGVWIVERDRIVSLGDTARLTVRIDASELYVYLAGTSPLPVRYELNGHSAGSFKVEEQGEYKLSQASGIYFPKTVTLFVPRGISVYNLRPADK